jgi:UDP-glucose 4-epimerase
VRIVVTGSAGHLGEALARALTAAGHAVCGLDILASPETSAVGSVTDAALVADCLAGADAVVHAATLHKPHVGSHARRQFVDTNITGTLTLLEQAVAAGVGRFVFTSTTSAFGRALQPPPGAPAAWIDEQVAPRPRNVYGATKTAAEDLCELIHRDHGLPCLILRTSRFFPEGDDRDEVRSAYEDLNVKVNELLYRRVDLEDVVSAHLRALERAPELGFGRFIVSATTPFTRADLPALRADAPAVVARRFPQLGDVYGPRGWRMFPGIDRVYDNARARERLGWEPRYDFGFALARLAAGEDPRSPLSLAIGAKGYHDEPTGPYTTHSVPKMRSPASPRPGRM